MAVRMCGPSVGWQLPHAALPWTGSKMYHVTREAACPSLFWGLGGHLQISEKSRRIFEVVGLSKSENIRKFLNAKLGNGIHLIGKYIYLHSL